MEAKEMRAEHRPGAPRKTHLLLITAHVSATLTTCVRMDAHGPKIMRAEPCGPFPLTPERGEAAPRGLGGKSEISALEHSVSFQTLFL